MKLPFVLDSVELLESGTDRLWTPNNRFLKSGLHLNVSHSDEVTLHVRFLVFTLTAIKDEPFSMQGEARFEKAVVRPDEMSAVCLRNALTEFDHAENNILRVREEEMPTDESALSKFSGLYDIDSFAQFKFNECRLCAATSGQLLEEAALWNSVHALALFTCETSEEAQIALSKFFSTEEELTSAVKGEQAERTKGEKILRMVDGLLKSGVRTKKEALFQVSDKLGESFENVYRLYYHTQRSQFPQKSDTK
jgi:hypothetical protein